MARTGRPLYVVTGGVLKAGLPVIERGVLTLLEAQLAELRAQKRGLMQRLLRGPLREHPVAQAFYGATLSVLEEKMV